MWEFSSVQSLSCVRLFVTPWNCSTPGFPLLHQLPELAQTHVHWVGDAIQPSHPLLSPSPPAFNLSQHQGLFQWVSSSHQVAKALEFQLQHEELLCWVYKYLQMLSSWINSVVNIRCLSLTASLVAQRLKHLPGIRETQVWSLGQEDPLEKENGNPLQYSCLGNPMDRGTLQSMGLQRAGHDLATEQEHWPLPTLTPSVHLCQMKFWSSLKYCFHQITQGTSASPCLWS